MGFNSYNDQKNHNSPRDSDYDNSDNGNGDDNIIPEIFYDNYDDDYGEDHSNTNLVNNSNTNNNIINNNIDTNDNNINNIIDINGNNINNTSDVNGINDLDDFGLKGSNHDGNKMINRPVDVRIIVDGPEKSEFLSKAIKNISLFNDFNIIISSIITTTNVEIAKNASIGSNIILIAANPDEEGEKLFYKFFDKLKTDFNYVEFFKFPKLQDIEITDIKNVENEVKNSIIRVGVSSIFDMSNINQSKSETLKLIKNIEEFRANNEKISLENDMLIGETKNLRQTNENLNEEIKDLQNHIDKIKLDFTDFKSRYSNIHSKNLLEVFLIRELWMEIFNEALTDDKVDKIVIATNKFRPENVIVGQDYVGAISKENAIDWLKIVKTALIFVENDNNELQEEIISYYKKKQKSDNNIHEKLPKYPNNPAYNDYNDRDQDTSINNPSKNHNNRYDDEDEDNDYDVANQFRNFWD